MPQSDGYGRAPFWRFAGLWAGLAVGNALSMTFIDLAFSTVVERSFFQAVALLAAWWTVRSFSPKTATDR